MTNKVHTMFAFCVPINKTQSVPNWGINAWNTLSATSNTPRNDTSQNKSGTIGISLKTKLSIRKHKAYFVDAKSFDFWHYLEEFNLSQYSQFSINNRFLRERGMASKPKMEYQVFLCILQKNSAMATLGLKEMGKFLQT